MGLAFAIHAFAEPNLAQQRNGAGLEHAGANPFQHVRAGLALQHDAIDAVAVENVGEQQARRPAADDGDLCTHQPLIPIASTNSRRTSAGWP